MKSLSKRGFLSADHPTMRIEAQPCMELSTSELVRILIYRIAKTNGLDFVPQRDRTQLANHLLAGGNGRAEMKK